MPRVAFLGTPAVAVPALRQLAGLHPIAAVFCNPDRPVGRGRKLEAPPVKQAGLELGLPVYQPERWKHEVTRAEWEALGIDLAIVVAYGHLLPAWMLDSCSLGVWNLHFSLLPRWRGAAPVNHAILAGDDRTGVALMRLTPGLDEGPVQGLVERPITLADTAEGLLGALAGDAARLLETHWPRLCSGQAAPVEQDHGHATLAPKLTREMAHLDSRQAALTLHRRVRALQPWPGSELGTDEGPLKVCGVGALRSSDEAPGTLRWDKTGAWMTAGDGQALELTLLQRPGKPIQPALQALQPWGGCGVRHLT